MPYRRKMPWVRRLWVGEGIMKFTAFWLLPPIGTFVLLGSFGEIKSENDWRVIPAVVAFLWLCYGIRAVWRYWRLALVRARRKEHA